MAFPSREGNGDLQPFAAMPPLVALGAISFPRLPPGGEYGHHRFSIPSQSFLGNRLTAASRRPLATVANTAEEEGRNMAEEKTDPGPLSPAPSLTGCAALGTSLNFPKC